MDTFHHRQNFGLRIASGKPVENQEMAKKGSGLQLSEDKSIILVLAINAIKYFAIEYKNIVANGNRLCDGEVPPNMQNTSNDRNLCFKRFEITLNLPENDLR